MRIFKWSKFFILFFLYVDVQGQSFTGFNSKAGDIQKEMESLIINMPKSEIFKKHLEAARKLSHYNRSPNDAIPISPRA
jgi:hypothetical protein